MENAIIITHIFTMVLKDEFIASISILLDILASVLEVSRLGMVSLKFSIIASIRLDITLDTYTIKDIFKLPPIVPNMKANPPE